MKLPGLVVSAPLRGAQGARVAPLLAALARVVECRFISPGAAERDLAPGAALTWAEWLDRDELDALPHLHILADDAAAAHAWRAARRRPGVTVLQDPGLATLHQAVTLDAGQPEAWVRALAAEHGGAGRRLARAQLGGLFSAQQRHRLPMLEEMAELAPLLVVRSRHAAGFLLPHARTVVQHECSPPRFEPDQAAAREALGLGAGPVLMVPMRAPARIGALTQVAAEAGAVLLPCLPGDDVALHAAACDGALALGLPFGATPLYPLAMARAAGRPVLAWEADPAAETGAHPVSFPADAATLSGAISAMLAGGGAPTQAASPPGLLEAARQLLSLARTHRPGCRAAAPAP